MLTAAPRRARRHAAGVDISGALNLVGALFTYLAPAFLLPAAIAAGYREAVWPFLVAGAVTAAFGYASSARRTARSASVRARATSWCR